MSGWALEYSVGRNNGYHWIALLGGGGLGRAPMTFMSSSMGNALRSASASSLTEMTRLHIRGSFFGPLLAGTRSALSSTGPFSGSIPCSWLSRSSGFQLSLSSIMHSANLVFVIEYSLPLIEIHLVIIDRGH